MQRERERERERPSEASTSMEGTLGGMSMKRNLQMAYANARTIKGHKNAIFFFYQQDTDTTFSLSLAVSLCVCVLQAKMNKEKK